MMMMMMSVIFVNVGLVHKRLCILCLLYRPPSR